MQTIFTSTYLTGLIVPLSFIFIGAFCKKIVRSGNFQRDDFFMGVELTLAAFSSQLIYLIEALQKAIMSDDKRISDLSPLNMLVALFINFMILSAVLAIHQNYIKSTISAKKQYFWLTGVTNILGGFSMISFVIAKEWRI